MGPRYRPFTAAETERLAAVRIVASKNWPWLTHAIFRVKPVCDEEMETFATDEGGRVYINPDMLMGWTVEEAATVFVHELFHQLRKHFRRLDDFVLSVGQVDPQSWLFGIDMEINDDLEPHPLPGDPPLPSKFGFTNGLLAEQYYTLLRDMEPEQGDEDQSGDSGSGSTGAAGSQSQPSSGSEQSDPVGDPSDAGNTDGQTLPTDSGDSNSENIAEEDADSDKPAHKHSDSPCGGLRDKSEYDGPELNEAQLEMMAKVTAEAIQTYVSAHGIGSVPGSMVRWAGEELKPTKLDWRRQLLSDLRGASFAQGQVDFSWTQVDRRAENTDLRPGLVSYRPSVAFGIDTSGSMISEQLQSIAGIVENIIKKVGIRGRDLRVFAVDASIQGKAVSTNSVSQLHFQGGGGTDMRQAFKFVKSWSQKPNILVVATDGGTPWPKENPLPGTRTIVALLEHPYYSTFDRVPSWCTVVRVPWDEAM